MFRKAIVLLMLSALLLGVAGCVGKPTPNPDPGGTAATLPPTNWGTNLRDQVWLNMTDAQAGWALNGGKVFHTIDGGKQWTDVTPNMDGLLVGASCVAGPNVFWIGLEQVAGAMNIPLLRTTDGGKTWARADIPQTMTGDYPQTRQIVFTDEDHGWLLVNYGGVAMGSELLSLYRTTDAGSTWQLAGQANPKNPSENQLPLSGVKTGVGFAGPALGWLGGRWPADTLYLFATADAGRTWRASGMPVPKGYDTAGGAADSLPPLFIGKDGYLPAIFRSQNSLLFFATHDGGLTWKATEPVASSNDNQAFAWTFASGQRGWLTDGSRLYTTGDGAKTWQTIEPDQTIKALLDAGYMYRQIQFTTATAGWALLEGGTSRPAQIVRTSDGGQTWVAAGQLGY